MYRPILISIMLVFLFLALSGMEGLTGSDAKFPDPKLDFHATVTDADGMEHDVTKASIDGKTSITGNRGKASLAIDFRRITRATVQKSDTKTFVWVRLELKNGEELKLKVKGLARCYGITKYGTTSVRMRDIKTIVFDPSFPKPKK